LGEVWRWKVLWGLAEHRTLEVPRCGVRATGVEERRGEEGGGVQEVEVCRVERGGRGVEETVR